MPAPQAHNRYLTPVLHKLREANKQLRAGVLNLEQYDARVQPLFHAVQGEHLYLVANEAYCTPR